MNPQNVQTDKRGISRRPAVDVRRNVAQHHEARGEAGQQKVGGAEIAQKWARYLAVRDERSHRDLLHAVDRFIRSETRRMLVSHTHLAEEAAQETLLGVERKIASLEPPEYPAAYIRRTLSNRMATLLHRESRRRARELTNWNPDDEITVADVSTMPEWYDFLETLRGAVTDDEFWTLILRHHFDFSYDEIGELLDKGSGAIRQIALRGRRKACERMSRLEGRVPAWLQIGGVDSPTARRQQPADPVDGQRRPSTGSAAAGGFLQSGRRWLLDGPSPIMPLVLLIAVPLLFQTREQPASAEVRQQPAIETTPYGPTAPPIPSSPTTRSGYAGFINPFVAPFTASADSLPQAGPSTTETTLTTESTPLAPPDAATGSPRTTVESTTSTAATPPIPTTLIPATAIPSTVMPSTVIPTTSDSAVPGSLAPASTAAPTTAVVVSTSSATASTTSTTELATTTTATTAGGTASTTALTTSEPPTTTTAAPNTTTTRATTLPATTTTRATTTSTSTSTTEAARTTSSQSRRTTTSNPGTEPPTNN